MIHKCILFFLANKIWGNKFRMQYMTLICFPFSPWSSLGSCIALRSYVPWVSFNLERYLCLSMSFIFLEKMYVTNHGVTLIPPITVQPHKVPPCDSCSIFCRPSSKVRTLAPPINTCTHLPNSLITTGSFRIV